MNKKIICLAISLILLNSIPLVIGGSLNPMAEFADGDGSSGDPYQISNWTHLNNVRNHLSSHFVLINDLDSDTDGYSTYNSGSGWSPIGFDHSNKLTGSFDGQNYTISDLYISRSSTSNIGLFGRIDSATISNIGVIDAVVSGDWYVGVLIGHGRNSLIFNSYTINSTVSGNWYVGGLFGYLFEFCSITASYSKNITVSGSEMVGGLIGLFSSTSYIDDSYTTGGTITLSSGTSEYIGGFAGVNIQSKIYNSYSTNSIHYASASDPTDKGFVGAVDTNGAYAMNGNFWDTETSGQSSTAGIATGKNTTEMQTITTFSDAGWDIALYDEWDGETWFIKNPSDYPRLGWEYEPMDEEPDPEPVTNEIIISIEYFGPAEDINHDGKIDVDDISTLVANFGTTGNPGWIRSDITKSGEVDVDDISLLVNKYGLTWLVIV